LTWASVGIGIAALSAVAAVVSPFRSPTGALVVHSPYTLDAFAGDHWWAWQVTAAGHPVAISHASAIAPGSVQFDLPPGLYTVTTGWEPSMCAGLAWVVAGETTTIGCQRTNEGLPTGPPWPSEVAATPPSR
jgi:hypothetical protein